MLPPPTTVLLTNDDGPPSLQESPYILGLYRHLTEQLGSVFSPLFRIRGGVPYLLLGWNVKVVLPSSQKSWIGKAYQIKEITKGSYFYPKNDGHGEKTETARPLKDGELAEWILLDGTPATCTNIALHNLWPGQIDLVISGPNVGRNTSAAFALSSGTIGAAMSSALSKTRSIALSYGIVVHPTPIAYHEPAHRLGGQIIEHIWHNWGEDQGGLREGEVDLYNVNIPLIKDLLTEGGLKIYWTHLWRNAYKSLFKSILSEHSPNQSQLDVVFAKGEERGEVKTAASDPSPAKMGSLLFKWAPDMTEIISPPPSVLPVGSDGWAIHQGYASVTSLRATFGEPHIQQDTKIEDRIWKMNL